MGAPSSGKRSAMDGETILLWVFITVVVLGVGSVAGAVHLGSLLSK
jgi:DMSO reductase anchor subunit